MRPTTVTVIYVKETFHPVHMSRALHDKLSRRERQIMDAIYALRYAAASAVVEHIGEPEAHDSVRITLNTLEKKGYLKHHQEGNRNIYYPVVPHGEAQRSAMHHLTRTFFGNSPSRALLAFLDLQGDRLSEQELAELSRWIEERSAKPE